MEGGHLSVDLRMHVFFVQLCNVMTASRSSSGSSFQTKTFFVSAACRASPTRSVGTTELNSLRLFVHIVDGPLECGDPF